MVKIIQHGIGWLNKISRTQKKFQQVKHYDINCVITLDTKQKWKNGD